MSDKRKRKARGAMSREEREARSRLRQLILRDIGLLRGTLSVRQTVCGKPNCKCARGERHTSHVLVASYEGRPRQLYVPASLVPVVRQWIGEYRKIRELLEDLSIAHWDKIQRREV